MAGGRGLADGILPFGGICLPAPDGVSVEFGVLGPLQVNGGNVSLAGKQRVVLAVLLLRANRVVPIDTLIDALWDDAPPPSARMTLQGYVKQLRQNADLRVGERVITRSPGYLITVADGELDLDRFIGLCDQARSTADRGDWRAASGLFGEALALWRGEPLERCSLRCARADRGAAAGRAAHAGGRVPGGGGPAAWPARRLVAELRRLVSSEPLRERLHGQLMLALYRCGRQAEALQVFRDIDRRLRGELGIAPGPELSAAAPAHPRRGPVAGRGLPPAARAAEAEPRPPRPRPCAGPPRAAARGHGRLHRARGAGGDAARHAGRRGLTGSGPVRWSSRRWRGWAGSARPCWRCMWLTRLREHFPDGQLYANLGGATNPLPPSEVISRFLRDLGGTDAVASGGRRGAGGPLPQPAR